jgi:hypothetical protein
MERLHPESLRQLRALVKLHGARAVEAAVREIEKQSTTGSKKEKHDE